MAPHVNRVSWRKIPMHSVSKSGCYRQLRITSGLGGHSPATQDSCYPHAGNEVLIRSPCVVLHTVHLGMIIE